MQAVLRCESTTWDARLLGKKIAGIPLLKRHLLSFREAGIREVWISTNSRSAELDSLVSSYRVSEVRVRIIHPEEAQAFGYPYVSQRADTLIDPRLLSQLLSSDGSFENEGRGIVCLDRHRDNYAAGKKSPYKVGVPEKNEAGPAAAEEIASLSPVGLEIVDPRSGKEPVEWNVGRYYWHRLKAPGEFGAATWKVLLATMKPTDGIYARTNRRVSLRISRILVNTPVTPNMVTVFTLLSSFLAGWLFAQGSYVYMVGGGFVSWMASMLDGVDGELARSKYQSSDFGCWLEMVCDYMYYVFVFSGLGIGLHRQTGDRLWFFLGVASVIGVLLSFAVIARQRKRYSRKGSASDFGLAFQKTVGNHTANPIYGFVRTCGFLATRAALPYYIAIFSFLGLAKVLLILIALGTNLAWTLTLYAGRLFRPAASVEN